MPKESYTTKEDVSSVFSKGYGLFQLGVIASSDLKLVNVYKNRNKPVLVGKYSFHSVYGKSSEEIYEFWGMILAAVGLFIIALKEIVQFFLWVFSILPSCN